MQGQGFGSIYDWINQGLKFVNLNSSSFLKTREKIDKVLTKFFWVIFMIPAQEDIYIFIVSFTRFTYNTIR